MSFWKHIAQQSAYHIAHPILRMYRVLLRPKASGARAIIMKDGEILLVRNIGVQYWSLPGGISQKYETPMMCLKREIREELNISLKRSDYRYRLGSYELSSTERRFDTIHVFVFEIPSFYYKRQWEIDEVQWFYINSLPKDLSPATRKRLEELSGGKKNIVAEW